MGAEKKKKARRHMNRKTEELNDRQLAYIEHRLTGKTGEEAKDLAGYADTTPVSRIESTKNMKQALLDCMLKAGLNEELIASKIRMGLNAEKVIYSTKDGKISDTMNTPDNETQHKYLRDILEIRGDIKSGGVENINVGVIALPLKSDEMAWNSGDMNAGDKGLPTGETI